MKSLPKYPSLYQINIRVWLKEIPLSLGRPVTLDDIPDSELDRIASLGFDWIWLLSVWQTSKASRQVSLNNPDFRRSFEATLPDLKDDDIAGSGFAIAAYKVNPAIGGEAGLKRFRTRLQKRNLRLMLDFVPNHMGLDHSWLRNHANYFIQGTESDYENSPQNYTKVKVQSGNDVFAYGRDPYFSGWPDTLQIDYSNPEAVAAMAKELISISKKCDGVRCDMAMLILPEVFLRTWGRSSLPFWPDTINSIRENYPDFCFMAEVYWDMEWTMQQLGFDYAYDKCLYDRLVGGYAVPVREHFLAGLDYQDKLARFLENHDEPRAAQEFPFGKHKAAAVITFVSPGLRFFHQGQFEGRKTHISPHLIRAPKEPVVEEIQQFYDKLLAVLKNPVIRDGNWSLIECWQAWDGNESHRDILSFYWVSEDGDAALVVVNYSDHNSQCYVQLPTANIVGGTLRFKDMMGSASYDRDGGEISSKGLFLDMPEWGYHIFEISFL